jgi:hypothetical protein
METLTSTKGWSIETDLTDGEAFDLLKAIAARREAQGVGPDEFVDNLIAGFRKYRSWTTAQRPWAHKMAIAERQAQRARSFPRTVGVLVHAMERGIKSPCLRIERGPDRVVKVKVSRDKTYARVTDGCGFARAQYFGKLTVPDGQWTSVPYDDAVRASVENALDIFEADPEAAARQYGHSRGQCMFCGLALTDPRSSSVGYGQFCAERHGMPWGTVEIEGFDAQVSTR